MVGVGSLLWKTLSLRNFHSSHAAISAASVKKGMACFFFEKLAGALPFN